MDDCCGLFIGVGMKVILGIYWIGIYWLLRSDLLLIVVVWFLETNGSNPFDVINVDD